MYDIKDTNIYDIEFLGEDSREVSIRVCSPLSIKYTDWNKLRQEVGVIRIHVCLLPIIDPPVRAIAKRSYIDTCTRYIYRVFDFDRKF